MLLNKDMVPEITINAYFGNQCKKATLSYIRGTTGGYILYLEKFYHGKVWQTIWGWAADIRDLELDDIQIILEIILKANNLNFDSLTFDYNIVIPHSLARLADTPAQRLQAIADAPDWYLQQAQKKGAN
jgi:hypothetical protein